MESLVHHVLIYDIRHLASNVLSITFTHVKHEANFLTDSLAKSGHDHDARVLILGLIM